MRLVETESRLRALGAAAHALPELARRVPLPAEEDRSGLFPRDDHEDRLGLLKSAQVVEVAVESIQVVAVAIAHARRRGRDDRDAFSHAYLQRVAALGAAGETAGGIHLLDCRPLRGEDQATCSFSSASRCGVPTSCQAPRCNSPET